VLYCLLFSLENEVVFHQGNRPYGTEGLSVSLYESLNLYMNITSLRRWRYDKGFVQLFPGEHREVVVKY